MYVHCKLCNIMVVTTKVHMNLKIFILLTWMHDVKELV